MPPIIEKIYAVIVVTVIVAFEPVIPDYLVPVLPEPVFIYLKAVLNKILLLLSGSYLQRCRGLQRNIAYLLLNQHSIPFCASLCLPIYSIVQMLAHIPYGPVL
jgi:hypothetical protein